MEKIEGVTIPEPPARVVEWTPDGQELRGAEDEKELAKVRRQRIVERDGDAEWRVEIAEAIEAARASGNDCCKWAHVCDVVNGRSTTDVEENIGCCTRATIGQTFGRLLG